MPLYRCMVSVGEQAELDGTADEANVLEGKTFYKDSVEQKTGTMPNNTPQTKTLDCTDNNQQYTIPKGYHDGTGKVKIEKDTCVVEAHTIAQTLRPEAGKVFGQVNVPAYPDLTATASRSDVRAGKTFFANTYEQKEGTAQDLGEYELYLNCGEEYTFEQGGFVAAGSSVAANPLDEQTRPDFDHGDAAITSANVLRGYGGWVNGEYVSGRADVANLTPVDSPYGPITSDKVLSGYQGWVNGTKITGSMVNRGAISETLDTTKTSTTIAKGYHNGSGSVSISLESKTGNNAVTPTTSAQTITPSSGKVLSRVDVNAIQTETRTGYNAVTPDTVDQTITPSSGKYLTRVDVKAVELTGNAYKSGVKAGLTFYSNGLTKLTGTAQTVGSVDVEISCGEEYVLPTGCFCEGGTIFARNLSEQTRPDFDHGDAAITNSKVLSGYGGWINGEYVTGWMSDKSGWTATGVSGQKTTIPEGYHDGTGYVQCPAGGSLAETTLWTNSSPSSNLAAGNVSLSQSLANFTYIKVYYKEYTGSSEETATIMSVTDFNKTLNAPTNAPRLVMMYKRSSLTYYRWIYKVSNTQVYISAARQHGTESTNGNGNVIVTKIAGLK